MMKVVKRIAGLLIVMLILVPGPAMAGGGPEESKKAAPGSPYGGRLNVGWTSEQAIDSLQFGENWELGDMGTVFWQLIYDQLWMIGPPPDYAVVPRLVERWETEDRQTWTFHIVRNAKWHDGTPLTAEDIVFSMIYVPQNMPVWDTPDTTYESIEQVDDYTVVFTLEEVFGGENPPVFWMPIFPKHIWEPYKEDMLSYPNEEAIGSGPFKLKEFKPAESMWLVANEDYWGERPYVDEVVFKTYGSEDTLYMALKKGEVDMIGYYGASVFAAEDLAKSPHIEILENVGNNNWMMPFNLHKEGPIQNLEFRKAIMHAIDRQKMVDMVYMGKGQLIDSPVYAELPEHNPDLHQYDYDPAKAEALLDEAGFVDSNGYGLRNDPATGENISLEMILPTEWTELFKASTVMKEQLKEVGLEMEIKTVDNDTYYELAYAPEDDEFDLTWEEFDAGPNYDWIWDYFYSYEGGGEGWNASYYNNPDFDELIDTMRAETDPEKRRGYLMEMQRVLVDDLPKGLMFRGPMLDPVNTRLEGYVNFMGGISSWINPWTYFKVRLK
jgi:peptide/nickel transport system substrate-binding protein